MSRHTSFACGFRVDRRVSLDPVPERSVPLLRLVHQVWHERQGYAFQGSMLGP